MPWKPRVDVRKITRQNHELAIRLLRVREELQIAERHRVGLEVLLDVRLERIDELTAQIDRLRQQNRRLDEENDRLAEMMKLTPPVDAATLAPK